MEDNDKMLSINVKPGWKNGVKISFVGEGDEALNTIAPDLVFVIKEQTKEANGYTREGNDLIYTHKISLTDALTDCSLKIPTLDDRLISLACPEVVSPFYEKRIAGHFYFTFRDYATYNSIFIFILYNNRRRYASK